MNWYFHLYWIKIQGSDILNKIILEELFKILKFKIIRNLNCFHIIYQLSGFCEEINIFKNLKVY